MTSILEVTANQLIYALVSLQVRKVIWRLFDLMPTPEEAMHADVEAVRELIEPLGLAPKRAPMLIRFSKEYVEKQVCGHGPAISYTMTAPQVTQHTLFCTLHLAFRV